ncbi:MAG: hypothetical protein JST90_14725 [Bacteroidetes bacterium]|nr:hypothetical protein [Bacteroidota bacterium]
MKGNRILFYAGPSELSTDQWVVIISNLITYGDQVWLRADTHFTKSLGSYPFERFNNMLRELATLGMVKFWDLEAFPSDGDIIQDRIISKEEHLELYEALKYDARLNDLQEIGNNRGAEVERTSKLIDYRQELWTLGLCSLCNSNQIIYQKSPSGILGTEFYKFEKINEKITQRVYSKFHIAGIETLEVSDIIEMKKLSAKYQNKIDTLFETDALSFSLLSSSHIDRKLEDLKFEFDTYLNDLAIKSKGLPIGRSAWDTAVNILSFSFAPATALSIAQTALDLLRKAKKSQDENFIFYMTELSNRVHRKR